MPAGRPELKLPEDYKERMMELGKKGKGPTHMAKACGMVRSTFYEYLKKDQEFSDAFEAAMEESRIWWEDVGQEGIFMGGKDNPFQASLYGLHMANRFKWSTGKTESKSEVNAKVETKIDGSKLSDEQLRQLAELQRACGTSEA